MRRGVIPMHTETMGSNRQAVGDRKRPFALGHCHGHCYHLLQYAVRCLASCIAPDRARPAPGGLALALLYTPAPPPPSNQLTRGGLAFTLLYTCTFPPQLSPLNSAHSAQLTQLSPLNSAYSAQLAPLRSAQLSSAQLMRSLALALHVPERPKLERLDIAQRAGAVSGRGGPQHRAELADDLRVRRVRGDVVVFEAVEARAVIANVRVELDPINRRPIRLQARLPRAA